MALTKQTFMDLLELKPEWKTWMITSIQSGLNDYNDKKHFSEFVRTVHTHNATARAMNRNSQINYHARHALYDLRSIRECVQKNRTFFILGDRALVSFKMLDANLRPKNYPTRHNTQFLEHRLHITDEEFQASVTQLVFPECLSSIIVGYKFRESDRDELSYDIYVVCPKGKTNDWVWQIYSSQPMITELFPAASVEPIASKPKKNRVRVVRKVEKEQDTDEQPNADGQSEQSS